MDSFPSASEVRVKQQSKSDTILDEQLKEVLTKINDAIKRNQKYATFFYDPIHPGLIDFLRRKGYNVESCISKDSGGFDDGTSVTIRWI